jgi:hypothetical protein
VGSDMFVNSAATSTSNKLELGREGSTKGRVVSTKARKGHESNLQKFKFCAIPSCRRNTFDDMIGLKAATAEKAE